MADYEFYRFHKLGAREYVDKTGEDSNVIVLVNPKGNSLTLTPEVQQLIKESLIDG